VVSLFDIAFNPNSCAGRKERCDEPGCFETKALDWCVGSFGFGSVDPDKSYGFIGTCLGTVKKDFHGVTVDDGVHGTVRIDRPGAARLLRVLVGVRRSAQRGRRAFDRDGRLFRACAEHDADARQQETFCDNHGVLIHDPCTDELCPDELCPDELCPDELCPDELCPDELCPDELCTDELCPDELCTDELCTDEPVGL
jgi:hypothetical protein